MKMGSTTAAKTVLEEANKAGTSAAAWKNVSSKDGAEVAEDASRRLAQVSPGPDKDLDEPADELEDQLMQMFSPSNAVTGGLCLGADEESESPLQGLNSGGQGSMEPTGKYAVAEKQAIFSEGVEIWTQEDGSEEIGVSGNILNEDLSLTEEVQKETDVNLTNLPVTGEESGKETSLEEETTTNELRPGEPVLVETRGTEVVTRQADAICSQFAQELITRCSAPLVSSPEQSVKTEVPNSCWKYLGKEPDGEEESDGDDVIILEELSEEDMQLALSRRANLGEEDADVSEQSLSQSSAISPPDDEGDSDTERFIKSVEEVLAAAKNDRERRRSGLRAGTEATKSASRLEQGGEDGEKASWKLQTEQPQTGKVQGGRSKPGNQAKTKIGENMQQEEEGVEDSPTRKKIKRFLLNEEQRENRRNEKSYYDTKSVSPRGHIQKVKERGGLKRPLGMEPQAHSHPDPRDSSRSRMPKTTKLVHLSLRDATNSRKFSYKGSRLTFAKILEREGVESELKLQPLLKPLSELPVWVESETMSLREETAQEREDREKREKRIARFGSTAQLGEQEQQEWQEQEWQQLREV